MGCAHSTPEMSGNKGNKRSSSPIGPILDTAPRTNPGPKRARVGA